MPGPLENASATPAPEAAAPAVPSPFADILSGAVPAVSLAPIVDRKTDPVQEFVVSNFDELSNSGLDYHETKDNHSVFFNPAKITAEEIDQADQEGRLFDVAPLVTDLTSPAAETPAAPAQASAPAGGALAGASVPPDQAMKTARLRNLAPAPVNAPNPVPGALAKRAL